LNPNKSAKHSTTFSLKLEWTLSSGDLYCCCCCSPRTRDQC